MKKYDMAVIGAGAGGLNSAFAAAQAGKNVVLVEKFEPGGECTWAGCIPSKALIQIAKDVNTTRKIGSLSIDGRNVMNTVRDLIVKAHQAEAVPVLEEAGIEFLRGTARIRCAGTLEVDGRDIHADHIIIATGSSPLVPSVPGLDTVPYLTTESIFQLETLPASLVILGAGAIGVELSQALQRLGVNVTLVERADKILPREDQDFSMSVQKILSDEGVEILTSCEAIQVGRENAGIVLTVNTPTGRADIHGQALLLALGRKPNTGSINLDNAGIEHDAHGIQVNEFYETTVKNIYAVGDVVGPYLFSHAAGFQARAVVENIFGEGKKPVSLDGMAWCTFTEPELARCGLTEAQARAMSPRGIHTFTAKYEDLDRAVVDQKTQGLARIVCDDNGLIVGASILGERACELLCELQVMKQYGIPLQDLQKTIHPYPGYSELLLQLSFDASAYFTTRQRSGNSGPTD